MFERLNKQNLSSRVKQFDNIPNFIKIKPYSATLLLPGAPDEASALWQFPASESSLFEELLVLH